MKYLMIREADGREFPAFCLSPFTHMELLLMLQGHRPGRTAVAGGFVEFRPELPAPQSVRVFGRSDSTNTEPRPQDARIISAFYDATLTAGKFATSAA